MACGCGSSSVSMCPTAGAGLLWGFCSCSCIGSGICSEVSPRVAALGGVGLEKEDGGPDWYFISLPLELHLP